MDWGSILAILIPMTSLFGFIYKELKDWRKETREEIQAQAKRSDRLYEMFLQNQTDIHQHLHQMKDEFKAMHGRICTIESKK